MGRMQVTLPDGTVLEAEAGATPAGIAERIGAGLARAAVGAKVAGERWDLYRPLPGDTRLELVTRPKKKGDPDSQDPDALYFVRHSAAHVMAEAIQRLWPHAQLAYGPPVENGFYYDIALDEPISSEDFPRIEAEMEQIVAEARPFTRYELPPDAGLAKIRAEGNKYKLDNAERALRAGAERLSFYVTGGFAPPAQGPAATAELVTTPPGAGTAEGPWEDLCMGPHLPGTGGIGAFKLMSVATSHWHGDVSSDRFQRVYGTAFYFREDLAAYLERLEQAKARDHRVLGQKLGLFTLDEQVGPGLVLWKPRGARVRAVLQDFLQQELFRRGYEPVYTPHVGKVDLYRTSGHYPFYQDAQFPPVQMRDSEEQYLLKPMNCPHHCKIYQSDPHSYRDLPVRLAEFGTVYRFEQSGELMGMTRARSFTQDDAHIFCTEDQVRDEVRATLDLVQFVFSTFGFDDVHVRLGTRADAESEKYAGSDAAWQRAERELREVLEELDASYTEEAGEAAFYGPKVDFVVRDVLGRDWQLGTVQLDYNLPERFRLEYVGADNAVHRPVMIHRAPFGSMERFMGILIEHYAGAFPLWLAPEQARVLPVSEKHLGYGERVLAALERVGLRATLDRSSERVNAKIRAAQEEKIPYMLVVGGKDESAGTVSVRERSAGDEGALELEAFVERARREAAPPGAS